MWYNSKEKYDLLGDMETHCRIKSYTRRRLMQQSWLNGKTQSYLSQLVVLLHCSQEMAMNWRNIQKKPIWMPIWKELRLENWDCLFIYIYIGKLNFPMFAFAFGVVDQRYESASLSVKQTSMQTSLLVLFVPPFQKWHAPRYIICAWQQLPPPPVRQYKS